MACSGGVRCGGGRGQWDRVPETRRGRGTDGGDAAITRQEHAIGVRVRHASAKRVAGVSSCEAVSEAGRAVEGGVLKVMTSYDKLRHSFMATHTTTCTPPSTPSHSCTSTLTHDRSTRS